MRLFFILYISFLMSGNAATCLQVVFGLLGKDLDIDLQLIESRNEHLTLEELRELFLHIEFEYDLQPYNPELEKIWSRLTRDKPDSVDWSAQSFSEDLRELTQALDKARREGGRTTTIKSLLHDLFDDFDGKLTSKLIGHQQSSKLWVTAISPLIPDVKKMLFDSNLDLKPFKDFDEEMINWVDRFRPKIETFLENYDLVRLSINADVFLTNPTDHAATMEAAQEAFFTACARNDKKLAHEAATVFLEGILNAGYFWGLVKYVPNMAEDSLRNLADMHRESANALIDFDLDRMFRAAEIQIANDLNSTVQGVPNWEANAPIAAAILRKRGTYFRPLRSTDILKIRFAGKLTDARHLELFKDLDSNDKIKQMFAVRILSVLY